MVRMTLSVLSRRGGLPGGEASETTRRELVDSHGRAIRDVRLSVTDRCNFRCVYCMEPETRFLPKGELLTADELTRVAAACMRLGARRLRITGGEPTMRPDLDAIVERLAALGPDDLAMTSNGTGAGPERLQRWRELGLRRMTYSLDSVTPGVFTRMTRSNTGSGEVIESVRAAQRAELGPIKINAVVVRGLNEEEVGPLTLLARELGVEMRFIEFMPLDAGRHWEPGLLVPASEILELAGAAAELVPLGRESDSSTSETFAFAGGGPGRIGVIAPVTRPFCGACSRLRITADGKVRPCLFSLEEFDLRGPLRNGASERQLEDVLLEAVWSKQPGHDIGRDGFRQPARGMSAIGG
ncbi:MAG: GTP 3',8-cyclase MoaA [Phycisphaerales bacterium]